MRPSTTAPKVFDCVNPSRRGNRVVVSIAVATICTALGTTMSNLLTGLTVEGRSERCDGAGEHPCGPATTAFEAEQVESTKDTTGTAATSVEAPRSSERRLWVRVMIACVSDTRKGMESGSMISVSADDRTDQFAGFFREFIPAVRGYVRTMVAASDVEPVVQATFETAWVKLEAIPLLSERAWLFGVARNHVRNHVRAERRRSSLVEALVAMRPVEDTDPFSEGADAVQLAPLLVALDQMTDGERELIQLLAWHEMEPAEIAVVLGVSQNAARVRIHRARKRLSTLLDSIDGEVTS